LLEGLPIPKLAGSLATRRQPFRKIRAIAGTFNTVCGASAGSAVPIRHQRILSVCHDVNG
jgi:hypothetical protein